MIDFTYDEDITLSRFKLIYSWQVSLMQHAVVICLCICVTYNRFLHFCFNKGFRPYLTDFRFIYLRNIFSTGVKFYRGRIVVMPKHFYLAAFFASTPNQEFLYVSFRFHFQFTFMLLESIGTSFSLYLCIMVFWVRLSCGVLWV